MDDGALTFDGFRVDTSDSCLWRGQQRLTLTPKAFAVLRYLLKHAERLVRKEDLFQHVWPDAVVSDAALTVCIRELRQVLGDNPKTPQYIETVHRHGYRFIGKVVSHQHAVASSSSFPPTPNPQSPAPSFVGREPELAQLHHWLEKALNGERQIIFVTGEAGIGKTALVEALLLGIRGRGAGNSDPALTDPRYPTPDPWIAHGQCIEQFGAGEPYLPLLSALGQLGREPSHTRVVEILAQYAPTWMVQMPALVPPAEFDLLLRKTVGATRERMLREMAEALEALTIEQPLLLVLEDLHWSDPSTLELLSFLARRWQPANLLVIGTYRPVDVLANGHPLRAVTQELQLHQYCQELPLRLLSEGDIVAYLAARGAGEAPGQASVQARARLIHQRTEGNPLFMVSVVDDLLAQGEWNTPERRVSPPPTIRQMIERQSDHLSPEEQQVVAAASVTGMEFSTAAVAAGAEAPMNMIEERCAALTRRGQFVHASGVSEWPDGTVATRYSFLHALYQEVLYERIPIGQRASLHTRIGEREEAAYGERAREVAAELAVHFERGHEYPKAVQYLQQAGENAIRRSAHQEAISLLSRGLELLKFLSDTPERAQQEVALQMPLGVALASIRGYAAPEVEQAYSRARELCQRLGETPQLFPILMGLITFYAVRGRLRTARELAEHCLTLAQQSQDPDRLLHAHRVLGQDFLTRGELALARAHLEQGLTFYDPQRYSAHAFLYEDEPGVFLLSLLASALGYLGYPDQALEKSREAIRLAQESGHLFNLAAALGTAAVFHQTRREERAMHARLEAILRLAAGHGFTLFVTLGSLLQSWALAGSGQVEEAIVRMRQGLATLQTTTERSLPYWFRLLAELYGKAGRPEEGMRVLAEALTIVTNGASLYLKKINDLAAGAISHCSKNPRKLCEKRFFLCLSVSVSP